MALFGIHGLLLTKNERNHGRAVAPRFREALDELLDLPHLNVLLGLASRRLLRHCDVLYVALSSQREPPNVLRALLLQFPRESLM